MTAARTPDPKRQLQGEMHKHLQDCPFCGSPATMIHFEKGSLQYHKNYAMHLKWIKSGDIQSIPMPKINPEMWGIGCSNVVCGEHISFNEGAYLKKDDAIEVWNLESRFVNACLKLNKDGLKEVKRIMDELRSQEQYRKKEVLTILQKKGL